MGNSVYKINPSEESTPSLSSQYQTESVKLDQSNNETTSEQRINYRSNYGSVPNTVRGDERSISSSFFRRDSQTFFGSLGKGQTTSSEYQKIKDD
jgi:hypothetical protein